MDAPGIEADSISSHSICMNENTIRKHLIRTREDKYIYVLVAYTGCVRAIAVAKPYDIVIGICIGGCPLSSVHTHKHGPSPSIKLDLEDAVTLVINDRPIRVV